MSAKCHKRAFRFSERAALANGSVADLTSFQPHVAIWRCNSDVDIFTVGSNVRYTF